MSTKLRPKVPCDCKKCNGKLVDTRTRKKHYEEEKQFQSSMKKGKEKEASSSIHASTSGNRSSIRKSQEKCTSYIHQLSNVHHKLMLNIGPYDVISMCDKMMCITKSRCALFVQDDVHCYFNYSDI